MLADLSMGIVGSQSRYFAPFEGKLDFIAPSLQAATSLYVTDLTSAGTQFVAPLAVWPGGASTFWTAEPTLADTHFFVASDRLYVSDGTSAGTAPVSLPSGGGFLLQPESLLVVGDSIYFGAESDTHPPVERKLYASNGLASGTHLVSDLFGGADGSDPSDLALVDGELVFAADTAEFGRELAHFSTPLAYTQDLGLASAGSALGAIAPALGQSIVVEGSGSPAGSVGYLLMSNHTAASTSTLLLPTSASWIDPLSVIALKVITTPDWSYTAPVPAAPALAGLQFNLQSWHLPGGLFPAKASNGLELVLGS
jgi:ELWxxDGT repeat protein